MRKTTILLLGLSVAACSVGPDFERPELYSDQEIQKSLELTKVSGQMVSKEWYKEFRDPILNQLVEQALKDSPNAKIAIEKLRQARSSLKINAVGSLPMIDADGSYHYNKPSKNIGYTIDTDYYQLGFDAAWEVDIWGQTRRQTESYRAMFEAAAANLDNVYLSLTAEIAADYISLRTAQAQIRIAEQNLKLQEDIYNTIATKNKYGLADNLALNQAQYTVENTKAAIPELKKQAEAYKNALTILVGKLPGSLENQLSADDNNLVRRRFEYKLSRLYELPVSVVRNRPDVRIAEHQLHAQNAQIGAAIANLYPNLSLSGFLGWQALKVPDLVDTDSYMYNYSPAISLPVFHWGALQNQVELQKETTREYFYQYQNSVLNAIAEIKNAMTAVNEEYRKNSSAYAAAKAQKKATELTLDKYERGLVEFSDVMTAEQNLLAAQNQLVASNGQIYQEIIAFYKASGGGYQPQSFDEAYMSPWLKGLSCKTRCGR